MEFGRIQCASWQHARNRPFSAHDIARIIAFRALAELAFGALPLLRNCRRNFELNFGQQKALENDVFSRA
jgi:hypothetical protein